MLKARVRIGVQCVHMPVMHPPHPICPMGRHARVRIGVGDRVGVTVRVRIKMRVKNRV